jgi:Prokaryotic phospholipase A2
MTRFVRRTLVVLVAVLALLLPATAASAATTAHKLAVLARWTQPTAASYQAWNYGRLHRAEWASYRFDWSTDYCTASPERPLGYNFTLACWHHDFGYRNYKAMGRFAANKDRLDIVFYADLRRVCATYRLVLQPACYSLAWTYYEAVRIFGSLTAVSTSDIRRAELAGYRPDRTARA